MGSRRRARRRRAPPRLRRTEGEVQREQDRPRRERGREPDRDRPHDQRQHVRRRADPVQAADERLERGERPSLEPGPATGEPRDEPAQAGGATTRAIRIAMPARSIARTTTAATSRMRGTGMTSTSTARMSTTARLSRTRSTTSVASVVQKGCGRAALRRPRSNAARPRRRARPRPRAAGARCWPCSRSSWRA